MCRHCKSKRKVKKLRDEVSRLGNMVVRLEEQLNMHATHPYPYYQLHGTYTVPGTFPTTPYTIWSSGTWTNGTGTTWTCDGWTTNNGES